MQEEIYSVPFTPEVINRKKCDLSCHLLTSSSVKDKKFKKLYFLLLKVPSGQIRSAEMSMIIAKVLVRLFVLRFLISMTCHIKQNTAKYASVFRCGSKHCRFCSKSRPCFIALRSGASLPSESLKLAKLYDAGRIYTSFLTLTTLKMVTIE